jgi:hypothetical protein
MVNIILYRRGVWYGEGPPKKGCVVEIKKD